MNKLILRIVKLEERTKRGDVWGNYTEAWTELMRRYDAVHGQNMTEGEIVEAAAHLGPPPALAELASTHRKATTA